MPRKTAILIGAGAAAVLLAVLYRQRQYFDPSSPSNLAYSGASGIVYSVTGGVASGGEDTLGGLAARFREWVSGTDAAIEAMKRGAPPLAERDASVGQDNVTASELGLMP